MKTFKLILFSFFLIISGNASAWVVNGEHAIKKIAINLSQVNIELSNGKTCFIVKDETQSPYFNEVLSLLLTLYTTGNTAVFKCSETTTVYSPWDTRTVYRLLTVIGQ